jgi:hypothetical protein
MVPSITNIILTIIPCSVILFQWYMRLKRHTLIDDSFVAPWGAGQAAECRRISLITVANTGEFVIMSEHNPMPV